MIAFVDKLTNVKMWVADNRVDEYKTAGYTPAVDSEPTTEVEPKAKKPTKKK